MELSFTYHAQSQALARGIPEWQVVEVIRKPDTIAPGAGNAKIYRKRLEDGILEVVCVKGKRKNEYVVLTMYYL